MKNEILKESYESLPSLASIIYIYKERFVIKKVSELISEMTFPLFAAVVVSSNGT